MLYLEDAFRGVLLAPVSVRERVLVKFSIEDFQLVKGGQCGIPASIPLVPSCFSRPHGEFGHKHEP